MPTIDALPAASASAKTDEIMCSQGGIARKVTAGQLLAGTQPFLALSQGQLLGRHSQGSGGVETIGLGPNLTLADGVLSAPPPFIVSALPSARAPAGTDIVPLAQSGMSAGAQYAQFMAGISGIPGINASGMVVQPQGTTALRKLSDILNDAVSAEDFGARGDGATDDTQALTEALSTGQPIRLGAKTYCVSGQWTITGAAATLIGVPGLSIILRISQTGDGAFIAIQSQSFHVDGVIFDCNASIINDSWGVLVTPACIRADFHRCDFANAHGQTMGSGLVFQTADPEVTNHDVRACSAYGNTNHGIWSQALQNVTITDCNAHDNGAYGICVDYADPVLESKLHNCQVVGCKAWNNVRGISIGNFNATNTTPPVWGNANPDAIAILIAGNLCHDNTAYGIAVAGEFLNVTSNQLNNNGTAGGAGVLANVSSSRIAGNVVTGPSQFGIDSGGSIFADISGNHVFGAVHGINPGGSQNVRLSGNFIANCTGWAVLVNNVETDSLGRNFGISCNNLTISDNWIGFAIGSNGGGVFIRDNPQNICVSRNCIVGTGVATLEQALWANSDSVTITGNQWNFSETASATTTSVGSSYNQIVYPDLLDTLRITHATSPVLSIVSQRQQTLSGQIGFVSVVSGGSGYTIAHVVIHGDGAGATAMAYVSNGSVIGIAVTNSGSGYTTATASITGDGAGATVAAQISLPLPDQRRLRLQCDVPVSLSQTNWTGTTFTVPANATIGVTAHSGAWIVDSVPLADYITPDGAGGVALTSNNGADLVLRPCTSGHLRLASASETTGVTSSIGRGPPAGIIAAPPGSDYRNLNGGAGNTFWIKQVGADAAGWVAIG